MGWFSGGGGGDTSGSSSTSSDTLDLSPSSGMDSGFQSKKRSPSDYDYDLGGGGAGGSVGSAGVGGGDVQRVIQHEQQKLQLMTAIHRINDVCWEMCVDSVGSSLSGKQETCVKNCSERFVDTTLLITNRFAQLAQKMQGGQFMK